MEHFLQRPSDGVADLGFLQGGEAKVHHSRSEIPMTVVPHHRIAQVNHTKNLQWCEVEVAINTFVLEQKIHA